MFFWWENDLDIHPADESYEILGEKNISANGVFEYSNPFENKEKARREDSPLIHLSFNIYEILIETCSLVSG